MNINKIISVDAGANGGICVWQANQFTQCYKMPKTIEELQGLFEKLTQGCSAIVFLEKLSVRPDDVRADGGTPYMAKLYRIQKMIANFEQIKNVLAFERIPFCLVHPMTWQSQLKLRRKGVQEEKTDRKRRYKRVAENLYPECKVTLWNADALLILEFGRKMLRENVKWVLSNLPQQFHYLLDE